MDPEITQLATLVRAHYPLIYVVSHEEARVESELFKPVAEKWRSSRCMVWTSTKGFRNLIGPSDGADETKDPHVALDFISKFRDPCLFVLKDFHHYFAEPPIVRALRDLASELLPTAKNVVLLSPVLKIPPELEKEITVLDYAPPTLEELDAILSRAIEGVKNNPRVTVDLPPAARERLLKATLGLTSTEAENVFAKAIVSDGRLDENDIALILQEKRQIIRKTGVLEYYGAEESMGEVGGLDVLKEWLRKRFDAFTEEAREYGIPTPKGILLLGVQGCGKSLVAKAVSSAWQLPLLRFDIGRVFGSYVGQSEEGMRKAIATAESVAPAILWIDEIEKGFSGVGGGAADSGVTARVFGSFLTRQSRNQEGFEYCDRFMYKVCHDFTH